ncbi:PAS domain-containing protein [Kordiimonas laminariae]|uniref:PAS domain-containing protein n=1 Tax=Kordiimonas laminariae TaxID=2917717 RepID=UPI001FF225CF|nr:PAS domain-containing protein [Kordiimonas laminariae]
MSVFDAMANFYGADPAEDEIHLWPDHHAPDTSNHLKDVAAYFNSKKLGRSFNQRRDLNPAELRSYLTYFMLLECEFTEGSAGQVISEAHVRLMGTDVSAVYGDGTGQKLSDFHGVAALERFKRVTEYCIQERTITVARSAAFNRGRPNWDVTALYVPFSDAEDKNVTQILVFTDVLRCEPGAVN